VSSAEAATVAPPAVAGLVLAAGQAARMDGRPKPLLELDGQPLVRRLVMAMADCGLSPLLVVAGALATPVGAALHGTPARVVLQTDPQADLIGSQRLGLSALPSHNEAVLIALADQPLVDAAALRALLGRWTERPAGIDLIYPRVAGEPGNPVVAGARAVREVLASDARVGCRQWREVHPERAAAWDTDHPAYLMDLDTPQDLERFTRLTGHVLHWPDGG
jgi:molybdenum cofactor cytidylyltransferase